MKSITAKLSLLAIGATLLAPAFAADQGTAVKATISTHAVQRTWLDKNWGGAATGRNIETWDVSTKAGQSFLALCVEPGQSMLTGTQDYTAKAFTFGTNSTSIDRLYGLFYASASAAGAGKESLSFQLALWELNNDNGSLGSGSLAISATGKNATSTLYAGASDVVSRANTMLDAAKGTATFATQYKYTLYTSATSQDFVVAAPVPEPATYAMLGAGLALVGFAARRRNKR